MTSDVGKVNRISQIEREKLRSEEERGGLTERERKGQRVSGLVREKGIKCEKVKERERERKR